MSRSLAIKQYRRRVISVNSAGTKWQLLISREEMATGSMEKHGIMTDKKQIFQPSRNM